MEIENIFNRQVIYNFFLMIMVTLLIVFVILVARVFSKESLSTTVNAQEQSPVYKEMAIDIAETQICLQNLDVNKFENDVEYRNLITVTLNYYYELYGDSVSTSCIN